MDLLVDLGKEDLAQEKKRSPAGTLSKYFGCRAAYSVCKS